MCFGIVLGLVTLGVTSLGSPIPPEPKELRLGISLYGYGVQSEQTQSRVTGTEVEAFYERALAPELKLQLIGGAQAEVGVSRARWQGDFQPRQTFKLRQALLNWQPSASLSFQLGVLDQSLWGNPLLIQRQSFPGLLSRYDLNWGAWSLELSAQQAFASDVSALQPWGDWREAMPAFFYERLQITYAPSGSFLFRAHVAHFLFDSLSNPSALQSQFLGNTVNGIGPTAAYATGFQGWESGLGIQNQSGRFFTSVDASQILNGAAHQDKSTGWRFSGRMGWVFSESFRADSEVEGFQVAADAAPAFYNDRTFGHNNRKGYGISIGAQWPKEGLEAKARWIQSNPISPNPYQSRLDWVQLQMSAQYGLF